MIIGKLDFKKQSVIKDNLHLVWYDLLYRQDFVLKQVHRL